MTIGHCKHGEFELGKGCAHCIDDAMRERRKDGIRPEQDELEDGLNSEGLTLVSPHIIKVQYYSETTGGLSNREYTYYSVDRLNVGDIVIVPVRDTTGKAKVSTIDVPEAEIAAFKDKVKTIPAGAKMEPRAEPGKLPSGGLAEAARQAGAEVHAVAFENIAKNLGLMSGTDKIEQEPVPEADTKINLCDTCSKRNDYPICTASDVTFGDGKGNDNITQCGNYDSGEAKPCTIPLNVEIQPEPETALALRPGEDIEAMDWHEEAIRLCTYAEGRVIKTLDDAKIATNDLSVISRLKRAMESKRKEKLAPAQAEVKAIQETYNYLMTPILEAEKITKAKQTAFLQEQDRRRREQEEINRKRLEAAQAEMDLKGELSEPVNLVEVQQAPERIRSELGSSGLTDHWIFEVVDFAQVPDTYKVIDSVTLGQIAKKYHDSKPVPGIKFINQPYLATRAK